jgi:tetratricopeptide (TPR) repeat protein
VVFCEVSEKPDPEGELELADACKRVKEDHISNLARMLDNTTVFLVDSQGIEDLLHEYGINLRYMGSLAEKVNLDFNKKILETEMIARACKRYFFRTFHEVAGEGRLAGAQLLTEFKECFVDFLNLLFIRSKQGEQLYKNYIYAEISRYYDYRITCYPPEMQGGGILHALSYHFGVRLKIIDYPFFQNLESIFNAAHILEVHGSAKTYDMDTSEIKQVCKKYKEKRRSGKLQECIKELKILSKIHSVVSTERTEPVGPLPEAYFWTELAEVHFKMGEHAQAHRYAELALRAIPEKHSDSVRPFQILLKYHSQRKEMNKGVEFYEKSLNYLGYHLGTNHPLTITVYNSFAYEQLESHDPSKCEKMFLKSLEICERSLGYTHATSSEILLQLAELPLSP